MYILLILIQYFRINRFLDQSRKHVKITCLTPDEVKLYADQIAAKVLVKMDELGYKLPHVDQEEETEGEQEESAQQEQEDAALEEEEEEKKEQ